MALAAIRLSNESINARHAPSFNAASEALERAFGFAPRILSPLGGARTKVECNSLGTSWQVSDHYEGSSKAAVDIDNQRSFRNIDGALFERILFQYGWRNIQINGKAFPSEPWHFANHDAVPLVPASTAGGSTTPLLNRKRDTDMQSKVWRYGAGAAAPFIIIDHLNMTYREVAYSSLEGLGIQNDIRDGFTRTDLVADPAWGANFGNGQFRRIDKPDPIAGTATVDIAKLAAAIAPSLPKGVTAAEVANELAARLKA